MSTRLISHKPVQVSAGQKEYGGVPGWLCFSSINVFGVPRRKMPFEVLQLLTYQLTINDDKKLSQYPTPLKFTAGGHKNWPKSGSSEKEKKNQARNATWAVVPVRKKTGLRTVVSYHHTR